jgi:hypothetical protein
MFTGTTNQLINALREVSDRYGGVIRGISEAAANEIEHLIAQNRLLRDDIEGLHQDAAGESL